MDDNNQLYPLIHANPNIYEDENLWMYGSIQHVFKYKQRIFAIIEDCNSISIYEYKIYKLGFAFFIKLQIKIPISLTGISNFGYAQSLDEKYLFICGGIEVGSIPEVRHRNIYVFDSHKKNIYDCTIKIPFMAGHCYAICMKNEENDELVVNGFIRKLFTQRNFNQLRYPPYCLIKIMLKKYYNENLHIIQINEQAQHNGIHYKINIMNIINAIII